MTSNIYGISLGRCRPSGAAREGLAVRSVGYSSRLSALAPLGPVFAALTMVCFVGLTFAVGVRAEDDSEDEAPIRRNMTPQETVDSMELADGFKMTLFAGEPDVAQPNAFAVDDRGRLWVGENYTYTKFGWKPDKRDRILIFEDTDGDGRHDTRKVFTEDITYVSGLEVGHGGVWVGSPPNLLFIPDKDGDDKPDGKPEVVLDGWGAQDQHETLNTFTWGPDGWLYGCHGVFTHSQVGKPGTPDKDRQKINAGVWRVHPVTHKFEVFAHGTSNPWGIDFDDHGQMLMTACVIPHLWHVIQGGRYHRQAGEHFNKHTYEDIKNIALHTHKGFAGRKGGHAHGGALLYLGDSFPEEYRGKLFMCNIHHHNVYADQLRQKGSGLEGDHYEEIMFCPDRWFLGFNLRPSPDGSIYIIDWYDEKECHGQTPAGKATGRIYKLTYGEPQAKPVDLAKKSNAELVKLQLSKNEWFVRHARRLLAERAAAGDDMQAVHEGLRKILEENDDATRRLRALWALHVTGGTSDKLLSHLLQDRNEYVRAWAIQLELEDGDISQQTLARYEELATNSVSPVVRLYLAAGLQRLPLDRRWTLATNLLQHESDKDDHNLPLVLWYGIEPLVPHNKAKALQLAGKCKIPKVRQFIARRATAR